MVPRLGDRFYEALGYAARLHASQTRKQKDVPYVGHLLAVTALVIENGADEDEAIAALVHDAIEDQGGEETRVEIERRFGARVAELAVALSDSVVDTRSGAAKEPWRARKERHLAKLASAEPSVRLIAACDKLHNLRELVDDCRRLGPEVWKRFNAGRDEQIWFYRRVIEVLGSDGSLLAMHLGEALADLEAVA
ncbi:MAG: bifunctional (p)ppGpp synthetase/guanosine-3',5'-bis(diphosphate) 3'-pyrophosphohydrolase [Deltaproteobacteria bacterium]|nr:bifunctional (p)ppGpp synthetase/guanosine-3',5'-bis(diphosphate) 3'-pyrophosphohydrolase [Deltaproteobacteria bacterium]